jgi:hypothetical protein
VFKISFDFEEGTRLRRCVHVIKMKNLALDRKVVSPARKLLYAGFGAPIERDAVTSPPRQVSHPHATAHRLFVPNGRYKHRGRKSPYANALPNSVTTSRQTRLTQTVFVKYCTVTLLLPRVPSRNKLESVDGRRCFETGFVQQPVIDWILHAANCLSQTVPMSSLTSSIACVEQ